MAVLNTYVYGADDGPALLAVHGITGHGRRFERLATEAWPRRRTYSVDLRGHGHSTWDGPWSVAQHVTDLIDTLDAHGLERADVIGHSYGSNIALALNAAAPERINRLVLLDPALIRPGTAGLENANGTIDDHGWATEADAIVARNQGLGDQIHPAVVDEIAQHLVLGADGRFRFRYSKPAVVTGWGELSLPLPSTLEARPTLVVAARNAPFVTDEVLAGLGALIGDQLAVQWIDSGHMLYWERYDETAAAVEGFLS